jgi:hypothetical protein
VEIDLHWVDIVEFMLMLFKHIHNILSENASLAAGAYDEQLDAGHKASCPWKGNPCAESLAQFLPSPISALVGGFNDRCDALLQFSSLPIISSSAIDEMKITRGPEIDRLLAKPVRETVRRLEDGYNLRQESIDAANNPYFQVCCMCAEFLNIWCEYELMLDELAGAKVDKSMWMGAKISSECS